MDLRGYFEKLKKHSPFSAEGWLALLIGIVGAVCGYGFKYGLLAVAEWVSVISDALIIVYVRNVLLRRNYKADFLESQLVYLPIFIIISGVLHSITYFHLGLRSLTLVPPMFVLLGLVYVWQMVSSWKLRKKRDG